MLSSWINKNTEQKKDNAPSTSLLIHNVEKDEHLNENLKSIEIESLIDDCFNLTEDSTQNNDNNEPITNQENNELDINFNDPGCWPTMTSRFRDFIVERGPYLMDQNNYFPVNDDGRHFDGKWFYKFLNNGEKVRRQWLLYSTSKNAIFCFACLLFSNNDIRKSAFSNNGFQDWKHLNPSVSEHENSKNHRQHFLDWKELEKRLRDSKTIDHELQNSIKNEKEKWFCILNIIVDGILFCAKNNLALRGSSDKIGETNCGIFLSLMEVISHYNPILLAHIKHITDSNKPTISYFSHKIQNEIICIMGQQVRQTILKQIKKSKYFSILFDCTPDKSHQEQMSQTIRYVDISNGEIMIKESFIDFIICTDEKSGLGLSNEILNTIRNNGLDIMDCRGQCYDNGANMAGNNNGVQSHILRVNELATFLPCSAHSLNLVGVHAAEVSPMMITFFGLIQNIYSFFSGSTSRWELLMKTMKITLKSHCDTRWSTKKQAVNALKLNFKHVFDILNLMATNSKDFNKNTSASAQHILKQINFKFLCLLHFWDSILGQIDKVNLSLQNQNQSIDVATKSLEGLIECIQNIRDSGFENALNEAKKNALLINIPTDFPTTRKIKRKINDLELNETKTNETSETIVKLQCYQSLDSIITSLKWRFEKLSNISSNFSFLCGRNLSSMEIDDIKKWSDDLALLYSVDLNGGELFTEVQSFKFQASTLISSFKTATSYDFLKCIHQHSLQDVYPNLEVALRIFLTMPVTTASCERSFSKLKLIKNYLRSTMGQERLSNLAILSIEQEIASKMDYTSIIEEFASKKARKVNIFKLYTLY
ncbi:hypothetical protein O181_069174 [Austropuccinia psidii MF-1]|uniref:TTF-type domain-containing protein n=1 Tax=Austropuccinia psidii MF-1 TaxID=1389203 RepID=A0A9Q3EYS0_9BASI|nr:hypothetical protein [Austropuccinia psidii MF-1]